MLFVRARRGIAVVSLVTASLGSCKQKPELRLTWTPSTGDVLGYSIERTIDTTSDFTQIARVGPGVSAYTDSGLTVGITYCYRVQAFNAVGVSPYTEAVCKTAGTSP